MAKRYAEGSVFPDFDYVSPWDGEKNFYAVSEGKKKVIFFLRYYGCTLTPLHFRYVTAECEKFKEKGAQVYVAVQSAVETMLSAVKKEDVPFEVMCDPEGTLYRLLDIGYLHYGFFMRGLPGGTPPRPEKFKKEMERQLAEAASLGISHGMYEGCEQQLPAVFVVDEKQKMTFVHYAKDLVDLPEMTLLLACL